MPAAIAKPVVPRKRQRKRKRRAVSSSSSSSSSSESDSDKEEEPTKSAKSLPVVEPIDSSPSSSSSPSESSSDSESEPETAEPAAPSTTLRKPGVSKQPRHFSPSPSPPPAQLPSFLNGSQSGKNDEKEQIMKEKFRKFWMASVADGFKNDLEEIRTKEPNLGTSRLALLIDSLASGADVFTSSSQAGGINEVEVILQ